VFGARGVVFCAWVVAGVFACFIVLSSSVWAQLRDSDIQLLQSAIQKNLSNNESIRTWSGVAAYERNVFSGDHDELMRSVRSSILFAVDKAAFARMSLARAEVNFSLVDGVREKKPLEISGFMQLGDAVYRYQARDASGPDSWGDLGSLDTAFFRGTLVISPKRDSGQSRIVDDFDPFWGFSFLGADTSTFFSQVVRFEALSKSNFVSSLQQSGNVFVYKRERTLPSGNVLLNEYAFDMSKGACLVRCISALSGDYETHWNAELEQVSDIWVPKKVTESVNFGKNRTMVEFTKNTINEVIPEHVFSLRSLGVRNRDGMVDMRTGQNSVIDDESLPELELPNMVRRQFGYRHFVLGGVGIALILIALFRIWWRTRHRGGIQ